MFYKLKKASAYKKGLIIYCVVLVLLMTAALIVLWNFLSSYQQSLPRYYAENYVSKIDTKEIRDAFVSAFDGKCVYETPQEAADALCDLLLKENSLRARKNAADSTADAPVFNIYCGKNNVATLRLNRAEDGAFGFERWKADSVVANPDILSLTANRKIFTLPEKAVLYINGKEVSADLAKVADDPFCSPLEKASVLKFSQYEITMPYSSDEVSVILDGNPLEGEGNEYDYPAGARISTVVNAPVGALVYINGLKLPESYISEKEAGFPMLSVLEESHSDIPKCNIWRVDGLSANPEIRVIFDGQELYLHHSENGISYYIGNEVKLKDYTLYVPAGASVTVNGIAVGDEFITDRDRLYPEVEEFSTLLKAPVMNTVYTFSGLIHTPDIKVVLNGNEMAISEENGVFKCFNSPDSAEIPTYEALSLNFTKTMMEYIFGGRTDREARLAKALRYTKRNSSAYENVKGTYGGIYYNKYMDITYNGLYVDSFVSYADNAFYCVVHYDIYTENKEAGKYSTAVGEYELLFIDDGNGWLIYELVLS